MTVTVSPRSPETGSAVSWAFEIRNLGTSAVRSYYVMGYGGPGPSVEILLSDRDGVAYQWSAGKGSGQITVEKVFGVGEAFLFVVEEPKLDIPPGTYQFAAFPLIEVPEGSVPEARGALVVQPRS